ncbi:hypothetical protein EAO77_27075 [Streptomyces sp. t39]|nr:hypothetical protein EAO77_27075 [Streptomyces sp. t39]
MDGVSTYLALIFGTLLSSQGTDASFKPFHGLSGRFPSVLQTLSGFSGPPDHPPCRQQWFRPVRISAC